MSPQETILIIGATGNIGVSAVLAALRSGYHVLAVVRNQASAEKLFSHVGSREGITTVEADIMAEDGVQKVVERVKLGEVAEFQHVFSCAGGTYSTTPLTEISTSELREAMLVNFESNLYAYRATIPYLLSQAHPNSTYTLCTGAAGDLGQRPVPGMTQGALFSLANAACLDNAATNVRFNELYLATRVEVDESAAKTGTVKASEFAKVYERLLARREVRSSRVVVAGPEDLERLRVEGRPKVY